MTADRNLLASVAEGLGGDPDTPDDVWPLAELAVRDTGRWLAERLAADAEHERKRLPRTLGALSYAAGLTAAVNLIVAACGVPEGGDGGAG